MPVPDSMQEIYSRPYPRLMLNQWGTNPEGEYSSGNNDGKIDFIARNVDYVTFNRAGGSYNDLFLDFTESVADPTKGLLKLSNNIKTAALNYGRTVYTLPYHNLTDVWYYESVLVWSDKDFWMKPNGNNIGSWDYCNDGSASGNGLGKDLWLRSSTNEILYYYSGANTTRPLFNMRDADMQEYWAQHAWGVVQQGFDGIFADNWLRTQGTGDLYKLSGAEFADLQAGWNLAGSRLKELMGNKILIGNSPAHPTFTARDSVMLEDRIGDDLEGDNSIPSYFNYTTEPFEVYNQACQDTYWDVALGPFETFRVPMNLLTDCVFGFGAGLSDGTLFEQYAWDFFENLGKIGYPQNDKYYADGVLQRDFDGAKVLMNNTEDLVTVILPQGEYKTAWGRGMDKIILEPFRGLVLKKNSFLQSATVGAPVAPSGLRIVNFSQDSTSGDYILILSWKDNSDNEIAWKIFHSIDSNTLYTPVKYQLINRTMAKINLGGLPKSGTYAFKVASVNQYGSAMSEKLEYDINVF